MKKNYTDMICRKFLNSLFLVLFTLVITSCNKIENIQLKRAVKYNLGKRIDFSWQMNQLLPDTVIYNCKITDKPIVIVSQVNRFLCPECLSNYLKVAEKYVSNFNSDSVCFVAIVTSKDIRRIQSIIEVNPQKVQVIHDINEEFKKHQKIKQPKGMWNVFLLDKDRNILLMGDPLTQSKVKPLYTTYIKERIDGFEKTDNDN